MFEVSYYIGFPLDILRPLHQVFTLCVKVHWSTPGEVEVDLVVYCK